MSVRKDKAALWDSRFPVNIRQQRQRSECADLFIRVTLKARAMGGKCWFLSFF